MGKYEKLYDRILQGNADHDIPFAEIIQLLIRLGFSVRMRGSHHLLRRSGVPEMLNLQSDGSKAKAYQVRQVRTLLQRYRLRLEP